MHDDRDRTGVQVIDAGGARVAGGDRAPIVDGAIDAAVERLRAGGVVGVPTETVYGLAAALARPDAIERVFALKGRPANNPLIAHVADAAQARTLVTEWIDDAARLAERFWPGPLTLVLHASADVPRIATGGRDTIAVRAPGHPVARAIAKRLGGAFVAPSANRSGGVSPTSAAHVAGEYRSEFADAGDGDLLVLDGGACDVGIESTVLALTDDAVPTILRPGSVTRGMLEEVLGRGVESPEIGEQVASPGTAPRHYAPRTPARLVPRAQLDAELDGLAADASAVVLAIGEHAVASPHETITMPGDPDAYARRLYAALREADVRDARVILIERPPSNDEAWRAVIDRLRRATAS